jgi:hypothetical protein
MSSGDQSIIANAAHVPPEQQVYMLSHIGGIRSSSGKTDDLDHDIKHINEQKKLIIDSDKKVYKRNLHDERFDLPERGVDIIQNVHPLGVTLLSNHYDRGYDYRDFPDDVARNKKDYDPYIDFLHDNGLIGKKKSRYRVNYIFIDSSNRRKTPTMTISSLIRLDNNPLMFNGQELRILMTDTSTFSPNDKITISGISPKLITLRSYVIDDFGNKINYFLMQNGLQFMIVTADNNMNINSGLTNEIKNTYTDMSITFNGFVGDTRTDWYFDTRNYIWTITPTILDDGSNGSLLTLTENVYAVTAASSTLPESNQVREDMLIAQITLDVYGSVVKLNNGYPYDVSDLRWTEPSTSAGQGTPPVSVPSTFNDLVLDKLTSASLIAGIALPNNLFKVFEYVQNVQNVVRPIFLALMSDNDHRNFGLRYAAVGATYIDTVRIAVPEETQVTTSSQIGNIPLNLLNSVHRMYLTSADIERELGIYDPTNTVATDIPTPDKFYIKLNAPYQKRQFVYSNPLQSGALAVTIYEDAKSDVTITYNHYGGVPINQITADLPVGFTNTVPYRYIVQIVENSYIVVDLGIVGFLGTKFGGCVVNIGLIDDISLGYPQPNRYSIELGKIYMNVVMVKMVSSLFPVTQKVFMDGSRGGKKNNSFYWQNIDDSETVYKIEIEPGNYTVPELKNTFENVVKNVFRISDQTVTTNRNVITLDIDEKTDKVIFTSYNEYDSHGVQTFISAVKLTTINQIIVGPLLPEDAYYKYPSGEYFKLFNVDLDNDAIRLIIYHPNNSVKVKDKITIKGSLNFEDIPAEYINGEHVVTRVSGDYYDIILDNLNTDSTLDTTIKGGDSVSIYTPNSFRIRFDYTDTFGDVLGFRDVGEGTSITPYNNIITNDVVYDGENLVNVIQSVTDASLDVINVTLIPIRNSLKLKSPPYIIMTCKELPTTELSAIESTGQIKDMFNIIKLNSEFRSYVRDTFSKTPIFYNDPLKTLSTLTFNFYAPDGSYYDFEGINHSFILQIVTYDEIPEATSVRY